MAETAVSKDMRGGYGRDNCAVRSAFEFIVRGGQDAQPRYLVIVHGGGAPGAPVQIQTKP